MIYRTLQRDLLHLWDQWNAQHFSGVLLPPHLGFGGTHARSLAECTALTDYGGEIQTTLNDRLVFGTDSRWVVNAGGVGHRRAVEDLFLRMTVRQYVLEHLRVDESRYYGYGPRFHAEVNRLSLVMGLPPVVFDRAGLQDADEPIRKGWPHNVRPEDYYGTDITKLLFDKLTHPSKHRVPAGVAPAALGIWELVLFWQAAGRHDDVRRLAAFHVDLLSRKQIAYPVRAKFERGDEEPDGEEITHEVHFDPRWLDWNDGTVRNIARGIFAYRQYAELPILADALEESGCDEGVILRHLRARNKGHDARCWVLKRLLA